MTLDEAIKHSEEVAEEHTRYNRYGGFESCDECAKEHRQLANWLKELKQLREQEHCEDAISRRAVLNTLDKMDSVLDEDRTVEAYKELLIACYNDLPSVTPTHIETVQDFVDKCRECGKQRWIPCSERLPKEEKKTYWICTNNGCQCECRWTNVNPFWTDLTTDWHWHIADVPQYNKVIAWKPLPEPYKTESEVEKNEIYSNIR